MGRPNFKSLLEQLEKVRLEGKSKRTRKREREKFVETKWKEEERREKILVKMR